MVFYPKHNKSLRRKCFALRSKNSGDIEQNA